jgi:hypothetical protein
MAMQCTSNYQEIQNLIHSGLQVSKNENNNCIKNENIRDLYRGINEFKKGYQPRSNMVKDENGDLADFHSLLNMWKSSLRY